MYHFPVAEWTTRGESGMNEIKLKTVLALALLAAVGLTGCAERRLLEQEADYRRTSMAWTAGSLLQREQRSAPNLGVDARYIAWRLDHDVHQTSEDVVLIGKYIQQDIDRFIMRQPDYRREIEWQLRGRPEKLERNAILMFY